MSAPENTSAPVCPVDDKTRDAWLKQARAKAQAAGSAPPPHPHPQAPSPLQADSCDSSTLGQSPSTSPSAPGILASLRLGTQREVSSIPRAATDLPPSKNANPNSTHGEARAANSEIDTGADKKTGNWIYPSEKMFFEAMKRKSFDPEAADMKTIVPIHNAVNERAWMEIKQWEKDRGGEACGGPRLSSFSGLSSSLTPRARFNTLLGYSAPFDRHDWVVDRCGTQVEYVIDFYAGKDEKKENKGLNFYLDVRPKLNSWEGVRMRVLKFWGL